MKRTAFIVWLALAIVGTVAVWWMSGYLDSLVAMAETDRDGALALFRSRVLPGLFVIAGIAVGAGAVLMRQGLRTVRQSRDRGPDGPAARLIGWMMACAGVLMAAAPLVMLAIVFWLLRRA